MSNLSNEGGRKPVCPSCGWSKVRASMSGGLGDRLMAAFWLTPIRCMSCNHRFYRFSRPWAKVVVPCVVGAALLLAMAVAGPRVLRRLPFDLPGTAPAEGPKSATIPPKMDPADTFTTDPETTRTNVLLGKPAAVVPNRR